MNPIPLARAAATIALAVIVALALLLAPHTDVAAQDTDNLVGTVIDAETKKPVVGALVSVWRDDTPAGAAYLSAGVERHDWPKQASRSVRTDSRGSFTFSKEPPTALRWLSVTATGFAPTASPPPDPGATLTIPLERGSIVKERFLKCGATGTEPATGLEILVLSRDDRRSPPFLAARFSTGADGTANISVGKKSDVLLRGPGIATRWHFNPSQGETTVLAPGGPVSGTVITPTGAPVAGVEVVVRGTGVRGLRAVTDKTGKFHIAGVACGEEGVSLSIESEGLAELSVPIQGGATGVQIVAAPGTRVRGRIIGPDGKPVAKALVVDYDAASVWMEGSMERSVLSRTDGTFELTGVPAGIRVIEASTETDVVGLTAIEVRPGADMIDVPVTLRSIATRLPVRVLDQAGVPLAGISIQRGRSGTRMTTSADGAADLPGRRRERESSEPTEEVWSIEVQLSGGAAGASALTAHVPTARALAGGVTIRACPVASLRVRPKTPDGRPAAPDSMYYRLAPADGADVPAWRGGTTGLRGAATLAVPGGIRFRLVALHEASGTFSVQDCIVDPVKGSDLEIALAAGTTVRASVPPDFASYTTDVAAYPSEPQDPAAWRETRFASVAKDGTFALQGLVPGAWTLLVTSTGHPVSILAARRETIAALDGVINVGEIPAPTVLVQGEVRSRGAPVPGALLALACAGADEVPSATLPNGRYCVRVPTGTDVKIVVRSTEHGWAAKSVGTGSAPIDFDLVPGATLVLLHGYHSSGLLLPLEVRSAGVTVKPVPATRSEMAVVRGVAPGAVEIVVGEGKSARTIRVDAPAGKTTFVDLATAK